MTQTETLRRQFLFLKNKVKYNQQLKFNQILNEI